MTDETREQIKRDTREWCDEMLQLEEDFNSSSFEAGATHQHLISYAQGEKDGFNAGLKAALEFLCKDQNENYHAWVDGQLEYYKKELEGLKTDIKK